MSNLILKDGFGASISIPDYLDSDGELGIKMEGSLHLHPLWMFLSKDQVKQMHAHLGKLLGFESKLEVVANRIDGFLTCFAGVDADTEEFLEELKELVKDEQ